MDSINSNLGFLKVDIRSWSSSWIRFRNNNNPRITKMYGEKSSPIEGKMIPNIVEKRIEIESARRTLVSYVINYTDQLLHYHKYLSIDYEKSSRK